MSVTTGPARRGAVHLLALLAAVVAAGLGLTLAAGPATASPAPTRRTVLRPLTASGHVVHGWRVVAGHGTVTCSGGSRYAVDDRVAACGSSAQDGVACLLTADRRHVDCVVDVRHRVLVSYRLDGSFTAGGAVRAPRRPSPLALRTDAGQDFLARSGGAWAPLQQHPGWVGFDGSTDHGQAVVYGPAGSDGINRAHPRWFVTTYDPDGRGVGRRHGVVTASYVGYAA